MSAIKPDASLKTKSPIQENEPNDEKKKNEKRILINEEDNEIILIPSRGHGRNLSSQRPIMGLSGSWNAAKLQREVNIRQRECSTQTRVLSASDRPKREPEIHAFSMLLAGGVRETPLRE